MSQDPLVYVPLEKWRELQSVLKADWPRSISAYTTLETQKTIIEKGLDYGFKVYCPFGDVRNGMVAFNIKDGYNEIIIQCPQDDTGKLEDALRRTKIINWTIPITIPFASDHLIQILQRTLGHDKIELLHSHTFIYDKPTQFKNAILPQGVSFKLISSEYLDLVNSTWPYRYENSRWYFQLFIDMESGYGLYKGNELISWVFTNEMGNLLHLYTPEKHRRKGYAELLLKLVSNMLVKEGKPVIAFCVRANKNAYELFKKVGFEDSNPIAWCFLNNTE